MKRLHVLAVRRLMPLDRHRAVPFVAGQDRARAAIAADFTPGADAQAIEQLPVEVHRARRRRSR